MRQQAQTYRTAPVLVTVLVLDDDPDQRRVAGRRLEAAGVQVLCASSLSDAMDLLRAAPVDVVVLDVRQPETLHHVLDVMRSTASAPIVVYSSDAMPFRTAPPLGVRWVDKEHGEDLEVAVLESIVRRDDPTEPAIPARPDFRDAAQRAVDDLATWSGIDTWMVTRAVGNAWTILAVHDEHYELEAGDILLWSDSFCSRMVAEHRPRVVPDTADDNPYADAPIGNRIPIGCYVGIPLVTEADGLFGTLCAIQPAPHASPESLRALDRAFHLVADTLSSVIAHDLDRSRLERRMQATEALAWIDPLTNVANRRAWQSTLVAEQARCTRYGHPAAVALIDLDDFKAINDEYGHTAGDAILARTGLVLKSIGREADTAFRIGGDEFAILFPETGQEALTSIADTLRDRLRRADISASIGLASVTGGGSLADAVDLADERMYEDKAANRRQ